MKNLRKIPYILALSSVFSLASCDISEYARISRLDAPIISVEDFLISWDKNDMADKFCVYNANTDELILETKENKYVVGRDTPTTRFYVTAEFEKDSQFFKSSEKSNVVTVVAPSLAKPTLISNENYVTWNEVRNAECYKVYDAATDELISEIPSNDEGNYEYKLENNENEVSVYVVACYTNELFKESNSDKSIPGTILPDIISYNVSTDSTFYIEPYIKKVTLTGYGHKDIIVRDREQPLTIVLDEVTILGYIRGRNLESFTKKYPVTIEVKGQNVIHYGINLQDVTFVGTENSSLYIYNNYEASLSHYYPSIHCEYLTFKGGTYNVQSQYPVHTVLVDETINCESGSLYSIGKKGTDGGYGLPGSNGKNGSTGSTGENGYAGTAGKKGESGTEGYDAVHAKKALSTENFMFDVSGGKGGNGGIGGNGGNGGKGGESGGSSADTGGKGGNGGTGGAGGDGGRGGYGLYCDEFSGILKGTITAGTSGVGGNGGRGGDGGNGGNAGNSYLVGYPCGGDGGKGGNGGEAGSTPESFAVSFEYEGDLELVTLVDSERTYGRGGAGGNGGDGGLHGTNFWGTKGTDGVAGAGGYGGTGGSGGAGSAPSGQYGGAGGY